MNKKKFGDLAYEYIRKLLVKPGKGGITSIPTEKEITNEMLQMFEKLRTAGYNVTNIGKEVRNADDLGFLINRIDQAQMNQAKEFSDAAEALETIQYKLNNNIPLNPEDQKKLLGKGFTTASEAFQGFTPKVIQGGKKEGIEQLLESGDVKKGVAPKTTKETIERKSMIDPKLTEEENIKNIMKENKAAAKRLEEKMKDPDKKAMGGRIGFKNGLSVTDQGFFIDPYEGLSKEEKEKRIILDKIMSEKFSKKLSKEALEKIKIQQEIRKKQAEEMGLPEGMQLMNQGGRIGFKEGGGMTRRTFLKLLGGLASIPLVGKFLKPAAKVAKTADIAKQSGVPAYFPKLVEKIKMLGDDISSVAATQERQTVTRYKGYQLTEDMTTGKKEIKIGDADYGKEEYMIYDPPETIIGKNNKPVEVPAQYDEVTVKPDYEGKMKDVDSGLDSYDEVIEEVGESKIKKSGGGLAYMLGE